MGIAERFAAIGGIAAAVAAVVAAVGLFAARRAFQGNMLASLLEEYRSSDFGVGKAPPAITDSTLSRAVFSRIFF